MPAYLACGPAPLSRLARQTVQRVARRTVSAMAVLARAATSVTFWARLELPRPHSARMSPGTGTNQNKSRDQSGRRLIS